MGFSYWLRLVMMVIAFVGVVWIMRTLRPSEPTNQTELNLCPTRVHSLALANGIRIFEKNMKWYRSYKGETVELDPIEVERWFSRDCALPAKAVSTAAHFEKVLEVTYVAGPPQVLSQAPSGEFEWLGHRLSSPQMEAALHALPQLPVATMSGHGRVGD